MNGLKRIHISHKDEAKNNRDKNSSSKRRARKSAGIQWRGRRRKAGKTKMTKKKEQKKKTSNIGSILQTRYIVHKYTFDSTRLYLRIHTHTKPTVYTTATCAYYQFIFIFILLNVCIKLCLCAFSNQFRSHDDFGCSCVWLRHAFNNSIVRFLFYILFILFLITCHWILNSFVCSVHTDTKMLHTITGTGTNGIV